MKATFPAAIESGRVTSGPYASNRGDGFGAFEVDGPAGPLHIIAGNGMGWDHVSVSAPARCPTWGEMEWVKRLLFLDGEAAMQLHVPPAQHVNIHPFVLHLWRPHKGRIPMPPRECV